MVMLTIPHRVCESTCFVNGLEDIIAWKGADYAKYLLPVVGGMASFAYLKFKAADPPKMVYWGNSPKYLLRDLSEVIGFKENIVEGRSFGSAFARMKEHIDAGTPVMVGAMDMYYLPYCSDIYHRQHVPIHYVLVVGYDDVAGTALVHDCALQGIQGIPYGEFEKSLDVKVPGMSKRNTIRAFELPERVPTELEVARRGFARKAEKMLDPPVKMFGIPAMRKLAEEVAEWGDKRCFEHMATYATTPPMPPESFGNSHGMRLWQAEVLGRLGRKYAASEWTAASRLFEDSGRIIMLISEAAMGMDGRRVARLLGEVAELEERAYEMLGDQHNA